MKPTPQAETKTKKTVKDDKPDRVFDSVSEVDIIMLPEEDADESGDIEKNFHIPKKVLGAKVYEE